MPSVEQFKLGRYTPIGDWDSEWAFCLLMETINHCIDRFGLIADIDQTLSCLKPTIAMINALDEFNFLLGSGEHLFVHVHSEKARADHGPHKLIQFIY